MGHPVVVEQSRAIPVAPAEAFTRKGYARQAPESLSDYLLR